MDEKLKYPPVYDEIRGVGVASGRPPSDRAYGPLRSAPAFYVGEHVGKLRVNRPDVERHANGAPAGKRNKFMRRVIRKALKARASSVENGRKLVQQMQAQTREVAKDDNKSTRWADRLLEKELDIHRPAYVPTKKELRAQRRERRAAQRRGELGDPVNDAIAQIVDAQAKKDKP